MRVDDLRSDPVASTGLLETVTEFHRASLKRKYYETFDANWKNHMQKSRGTQAWIAECHRLLEWCVQSAREKEYTETRQALEVLFDLLREIDEGHRDIIFFADEAGSWQVGVNWNDVLPAYFKCLAQTAESDAYAQAVISIIENQVDYDRVKFLKRARTIANAPQKKALGALMES